MSEPKTFSNSATIVFMVILSVTCAVILSVLASALAQPQDEAKELYRSKQMLVSAQIYNLDGHHFQLLDDKGNYIPARFSEEGELIRGTVTDIPTKDQILEVYRHRIKPFLIDAKGNLVTFADAGINETDYMAKNKKRGYYVGPYKLIYQLLSNSPEKDQKIEGYIIPVNGFGLWDAIYGYLAIKPDGLSVIGISWYDQKETPGLGANIAESAWQGLFRGKRIFQIAQEDAQFNLALAPVGITVVRGKVSEVLGDSPKAKSAVDGMAGATLTGNGVTAAYTTVLEAYRPFLVAIHEQSQGDQKKSSKG